MRSILTRIAVVTLAAAAFLFAAAEVARAQATVINADSISSTIRFLSIDSQSGQLRTRFVLREAPLGIVADSLAARLGRAAGVPVTRLSFGFERVFNYEDSTYTAQNLVALLPGTGAVPGAFLVSAHYDAIALRTPGWVAGWKTLPAPGADDNASGVGGVLELARALGRDASSLPFDVLFVLFSAEELDRIGSAYFVENELAAVYGERVIGVLNMDMIGYTAGEHGATIVSNPASLWLVDRLLEEAERGADVPLPIDVLNPGPNNSDHQAFWAAGISAVSIMEPLLPDGALGSPYYHTVLDTLGRVDIGQAQLVTDLAWRVLESAAFGQAEVGFASSDLLLRYRGLPTVRTTFRTGDTVSVWARARNSGAADATGSVRLRVTVENARGLRTLFDEAIEAPRALDATEALIPIVLDDSHAGGNIVRAEVVVSGMNDDPRNNAATVRFGVEGAGGPVVMHSVQPNPVRGDLAAASLVLNLAEPIDVRIDLLTIEGERLGTAHLGSRWGAPLAPGLNRVPLSTVLSDPADLASGMYLYRLAVEGSAEPLIGRFAVVR